MLKLHQSNQRKKMKQIYILAITILFFNGCNTTQDKQIENKFNIYISKLSNEEIEDNLSRGLKPIAIKDNIDVKGFANTAGSLALKDNRPSNNAFLIQKLVDNGYEFVINNLTWEILLPKYVKFYEDLVNS